MSLSQTGIMRQEGQSKSKQGIINIKSKGRSSSHWKKKHNRSRPDSIQMVLYSFFAGTMFTSGLLIVILKAPDLADRICLLSFNIQAENPINYNTRPITIATGDFNNDTRLDLIVAFAALDSFEVLLGVGDGNFTTDHHRYFTAKHASLTSIAIGDINNDGSKDICLTYYGLNQIGIFLGSPNGSFHLFTTISTGNIRPIWATITDFNDDQQQDIGIVNHGYDNITLLYGDGTGLFAKRDTYWMGFDSSPSTMIAADMNADGLTDVVVVNTGTNSIAILFRNQESNLQDPIIYSTGFKSKPNSLVAGYFNEDRFLDLAVTNQGTRDIVILFGSIDGILQEHARYSFHENVPYMILIADFNKDSISDLVVTNIGDQSVGFLAGSSSGNFETPIMYKTGSRLKLSMAIGDFNNDDELDMVSINYDTNTLEVFFWGYRLFHEQTRYETGFLPYSIHLADLNSDRHLDIMVPNRGSGNISIFFGDGKGNFQSQITFATGKSPLNAGVVDLNHDGYLDIVVANLDDSSLTLMFGKNFNETRLINLFMRPWDLILGDFNGDSEIDIVVVSAEAGRILILMGIGDGYFSESVIISTSKFPTRLDFCDFNHNGILDFVSLYSDNTMGVFFGNGDGTFVAPIIYETGSGPSSLAIADLNNDNQSDIIVSNRWDHSLSIYFGSDNGTFMNQMKFSIFSRAEFVNTIDLNNDGRMDIIIAYFDANKFGVLLGRGDGTFRNQTMYDTGSAPLSIATGDFDGDQKLDVVVANYGGHTIDVFIQNTTQMFMQMIAFSPDTGSSINWMMIHDLDHDGLPDILTTAYGTKTIAVSFGLGDGRFAPAQAYKIGYRLIWATIGDFNGDQRLDIALANTEKRCIHLLIASAHRTFELQRSSSLEFSSIPLIVEAGDFDSDGKSELLLAIEDSNQLHLLVSHDVGYFHLVHTYKTRLYPGFLVAGDVNNDSFVDIVVLHHYGNEILVYLGVGDGSFGEPIIHAIEQYPFCVVLHDFNEDQILDMAVTSYSSGNISVLLGSGNGTFYKVQSYWSGLEPVSLVAGDLNEDGKLDVMVANYKESHISILFGYGDGSFQNKSLLYAGYSIYWISIGYFNRDYHIDLAAISYETSELIIFLGHGDGNFQRTQVYLTNAGPIHFTLHDLDYDSYLDIVVVCYNDELINIFFGHGNGTFSTVTLLSTGILPAFSAIEDINHDGMLDILVANQADNTIGVYLNSNNRSFKAQHIFHVGSHPRPMVIVDFNRDGRFDIAVANFWANTFEILIGSADYALTEMAIISGSVSTQPSALVLADLNGDNNTDIITADRFSKTISIFFGHGDVTFSHRHDFTDDSLSTAVALATGNFNQDDLVDIVAVYKNNHKIVILLSTLNGTFTIGSIYSTGMESYPNHVSVGYLNNDSYLDIVVSNSGRNNIGVFIGLGNGDFEIMIPVAIPYGSSPFSVGIGDFNQDKKMDLAVANRDADNINILLQSCLDFTSHHTK